MAFAVPARGRRVDEAGPGMVAVLGHAVDAAMRARRDHQHDALRHALRHVLRGWYHRTELHAH